MALELLESQTLKDVKKWKAIYDPDNNGINGDSKKQLILDLITGFETFGNAFTIKLDELKWSHSHEWLERTADNALMDYWEQIRRAAEQHQEKHYRDMLEAGYTKLEEYKKGLENRLQKTLNVDIVLYFGSVGQAKRFPFGKTYLISVPLIDAYQGDWLAIPHELGHHVFWNTRFSTNDKGPVPTNGGNFLAEEAEAALDRLKKAQGTPNNFNQKPQTKYIKKMLDNWTEEIFADVVGTRIAGQPFVNASWSQIKKMVDANNKAALYIDDGEHPIPYLLPYIRAFAMNPKNPATDHIKWDEYRGVDKITTLTPEGDLANPISISDLRDYVINTFVQGIVTKLQKTSLDTLITNSQEPLKELEGLIKNTLDNPSQNDVLMAMLTPVILQKNLAWRCRNGHLNTSWPCSQCNAWW